MNPILKVLADLQKDLLQYKILTDSHEIAFSQTGHQFKSHIFDILN